MVRARLFIVFLDWNGLEVFRLEDLVADEALHVIHAVSAGDDFGLGMFTSGLHNKRFNEKYSNWANGHVKSHPGGKYPEPG